MVPKCGDDKRRCMCCRTVYSPTNCGHGAWLSSTSLSLVAHAVVVPVFWQVPRYSEARAIPMSLHQQLGPLVLCLYTSWGRLPAGSGCLVSEHRHHLSLSPRSPSNQSPPQKKTQQQQQQSSSSSNHHHRHCCRHHDLCPPTARPAGVLSSVVFHSHRPTPSINTINRIGQHCL